MNNLALALLTLVLTVCVTLAATNPTTDDYLLFIEAKLSQALERMDPAEPSGAENRISSALSSGDRGNDWSRVLSVRTPSGEIGGC